MPSRNKMEKKLASSVKEKLEIRADLADAVMQRDLLRYVKLSAEENRRVGQNVGC